MSIYYESIIPKNPISRRELLEECLRTDTLVEDKLHVIAVLSNYCNYKRRLNLFREFIERMEKNQNVNLYIVELAYGNQDYKVTESNNPMHLQLRSNSLIFHKENMINLGVQKLLPQEWKAMAWIDADIEFMDPNWATDTLKTLTKFDVVQLFYKCDFLDQNCNVSQEFYSYGSKYCNGDRFEHGKGYYYWHSGFAWACRRDFYDLTNGLYDKGILGSGDYIMSQVYLGRIANADKTLKGFENDIKKYGEPLKNYDVKVGYIKSTIRHFFHGQRVNRKYVERNVILKDNKYNPDVHLCYDSNGVLEYTEFVTDSFKNGIINYFVERNEDEFYEEDEDSNINEVKSRKGSISKFFSCFEFLFK